MLSVMSVPRVVQRGLASVCCSRHGTPISTAASFRGFTVAGLQRATFAARAFPSPCRRIFQRPGTTRTSVGYTQARHIHTTQANRDVLKSPFPDVELPKMPITEYCFKDSESYGNRLALINAQTGQSYNYSQLKDAIWRVSSGLARYGVRKGDVVVMISFNNPEYIIMFHSILSLGAVVTMVNPTYTVEEVSRQLDDSKASFIYVDESSIPIARGLTQTVAHPIKKFFVLGRAEGCVPFSELQSDDGTARPLTVYVDPMDTAILPYSSGTTGVPKGVMINHYGSSSNVQQCQDDAFWERREGMIHLAYLPFYHIFAIHINVTQALAWGQTNVILSKFEPHLFYGSIQTFKAELIFLVPPIIIMMCKDVLADKYDLSSMERLNCSAAPLGPDLAAECWNKYPDAVLGQGYGMTESGPTIALTPLCDCKRKPGSAGQAIPNTEIKFMNYETGAECGVGERGELWARGPQMMKGYLNQPKATAETLDEQQWLHTGDIGYYDEEEHVYIVDRLKELIKYKAFQVAPAELEDLLLKHPKVKDAGVTGVPDDMAGELPRAYVVLKPECHASEEEIKQYVIEHVASYKRLRGGVEFVAEIPKSASGKILRRVLKEMAKESITK